MDRSAKDPALPKNPDPVKVGARIDVAEPDYCYGSGHLHLRVTAAGPLFVWHNGDLWQTIHGLVIHWNGQELGERVAHVRARGVRPLPRQRRG